MARLGQEQKEKARVSLYRALAKRRASKLSRDVPQEQQKVTGALDSPRSHRRWRATVAAKTRVPAGLLLPPAT